MERAQLKSDLDTVRNGGIGDSRNAAGRIMVAFKDLRIGAKAWEELEEAYRTVIKERDDLKAHASDAEKAFDLYGKTQDRPVLIDALIPFTSHKIPCPFVTLLEEHKGDEYKCTCGLDEAIDSYCKGEKPARCECGADAEACKQARERFGVHLESGCGIRQPRD